MRAVDIDVQSGEFVLERIRHETLRRQVVQFVGLDLADGGVEAGETLQSGRVQVQLVENMGNPRETMGGILEGRPPHQPVNLVALLQ